MSKNSLNVIYIKYLYKMIYKYLYICKTIYKSNQLSNEINRIKLQLAQKFSKCCRLKATDVHIFFNIKTSAIQHCGQFACLATFRNSGDYYSARTTRSFTRDYITL